MRNDYSNHGEIVFACSDFGIGIYANVRNKLKISDNHLRSNASEHISFTDAYKFAFTIGKTTSSKTRNKGVGMSMIMDGANELHMDISIWDGRSMLNIPNANTHSELRKKAIDTGSSVGFYYYGRLKY